MASLFNTTDKLRKTKYLPPGHVDRTEAEKALNKEYEKCRQIEHKWHSRFRGRRGRLLYEVGAVENAVKLCNEICDSIGERRLKDIFINSPEVEWALAHYHNRCIHFKFDYISIGTLMHELAHHCGCGGHGEKFCIVLDFLLQIAYTKMTGKQPKKDWVLP